MAEKLCYEQEEQRVAIESPSQHLAKVTTDSSCPNSSCPKPSSYPKSSRLRTRKEIVRLQHGGKKIHTKNFILIYRKLNPAAYKAGENSQLAITVSKRVDKRAVVRNLIKRRVRELFRTHRGEFKVAIELLVIARKSSVQCSFQEMKRQIIGSLRYQRLLLNPNRALPKEVSQKALSIQADLAQTNLAQTNLEGEDA